jgi:malonyl CoA-acyl carrier protein transacylase
VTGVTAMTKSIGDNRGERFINHRPVTLQQAAGIAGVSPDTIARWCKRYGIGKQLHPKAPWRVDSRGLSIVISGDAEALASFHAKASQAFETEHSPSRNHHHRDGESPHG